MRQIRPLLHSVVFSSAILYVVIAAGIAMVLFQFFYNRDLWLDEAMLANNIVGRSFGQLFNPLADNQMAPIGYLLLNKLLTVVFGTSSYILRLPSLVAFLVSIPLLGQFVRIHTRKVLLPVLTMAFFSTTYAILYYATEVKQYAVEILVLLLLLRLLIIERPYDRRWLIVYLLVGVISFWFSHTAIFAACTCGLYLTWQAITHKRFILLSIPGAWAFSAILYYVLFLHNHPASVYMHEYWKDSFLPVAAAHTFLVSAVKEIFAQTLGFGKYWIAGVLLAFSGTIFFLKEKRYLLVFLCCTPVVLHLIVSALHLYPFEGRLTIYLVPLWWILVSAGLYAPCNLLAQRFGQPLLSLILIPVCITLYATTQRLPVEREEITPLLTFLAQRKQPSEQVYVYYGAMHALTYYEMTGKSHLGKAIVEGMKSRKDRENYHDLLRTLHGRAWLLFSHVYDRKNADNEQAYIISFLEAQGARILEEYKATGSTLYYVDTGKPQE
jgi:hypothetical protein